MAKTYTIDTGKAKVIFHSTDQVLDAVAASQISLEQAKEAIDGLKSTYTPGKITFKVSRQGAASVYGLQRMPVTLYVEQWERLLSDENVKAFREWFASNPTQDWPADTTRKLPEVKGQTLKRKS